MCKFRRQLSALLAARYCSGDPAVPLSLPKGSFRPDCCHPGIGQQGAGGGINYAGVVFFLSFTLFINQCSRHRDLRCVSGEKKISGVRARRKDFVLFRITFVYNAWCALTTGKMGRQKTSLSIISFHSTTRSSSSICYATFAPPWRQDCRLFALPSARPSESIPVSVRVRVRVRLRNRVREEAPSDAGHDK